MGAVHKTQAGPTGQPSADGVEGKAGDGASVVALAASQIPCMCANLRRATRAMTRLYDEAVGQVGLKSTQFTLLMVLEHAGRLRQHEVADVLLADPTTLSRTLAPLRAKGWLIDEVGEDRRERLWSITPAGRRKLEAATRRWAQVQAKVRQDLGEAQWTTLASLLERVGAAAA
jgi:DNA-binding MarR family transcriptional regulator